MTVLPKFIMSAAAVLIFPRPVPHSGLFQILET